MNVIPNEVRDLFFSQIHANRPPTSSGMTVEKVRYE